MRGIELLASASPDSERMLMELIKNSKDVLKQGIYSARNYRFSFYATTLL